MTYNIDRWKYYCTTVMSPDSFIEFGFYFAISAALQRRVWRTLGKEGRVKTFPNQYLVFVAGPGIGKGLITREVTRLHSYHKKIDAAQKGSDDKELPLLFPLAPSSITYEAFVLLMGKNIRAVHRKEEHMIYTHCSMSIILEEIASLIKKNTETTSKFLLELYDCGSYTNTTVGRNSDVVLNSCLNLLAGTQPSYMKRVFGTDLITDGLASRTIFLYEEKNRFESRNPPEFSEDQTKEWYIIAEHYKQLGDVFGNVILSPDADAFFEEWWLRTRKEPINKSPLIDAFRARENMTVVKLAMAIHYADKLDNVITLEEFQKAVKLLEWAEKKMHLALDLDCINPLGDVSKKILHRLRTKGKANGNKLFAEFYLDLPEPAKKNLNQVLKDMEEMRLVTLDKMDYVAI